MLNKDRLKPASKGDPSLLVCTIPATLAAVENDVDVFALPMDFRPGGMLIAVPRDTFRPQVIADGQLGSDETMVGPNSVFTAPLIEESEDFTTTVSLGIEAEVLVVDVTDDILLAAREYDPVTDHMANILGFSLDHPTSLPDANLLLPKVREWVVERGEDVLGFYTAQEDLTANPKIPVPSQASPAKKATQAKRITNNMIADQLNALSAQMQLLAQRQESLEKSSASYAANVPGPFVGPSSKLPAVSGGLIGAGVMSTAGAAKALTLLSPPPKVRNTPAQLGATDVAPDEPYDVLQPEGDSSGGIVAAIAQQSTAITQLVAHLALSVRGCAWGPRFRKSTAEYYKRRSAQGEDAKRPSARDQYLLSADAPTNSQEAPAFEAGPTDRSRVAGCVSFDIPRTSGRLQEPSGTWTCGLDIGSCGGCSICRRFQADKRGDSLVACGSPAGSDGQGGLDACIPPHAPRRTSSTSFPREVNECGPSQQAFRPISATAVDCSGFVLPEGSRGPGFTKNRNRKESGEASACNSSFSGQRRSQRERRRQGESQGFQRNPRPRPRRPSTLQWLACMRGAQTWLSY